MKQLWGSFGLVINRHRVILQQRNDTNPVFNRKWAMPGSIVQFGEHPEATLERACLNEIGIGIEIIDLIPIIQNYLVEGDKQLLLIHYLAITKEDYLVNLDDGSDIIDVKWVDFEKVPEVELIRGNEEIIRKGLKMWFDDKYYLKYKF